MKTDSQIVRVYGKADSFDIEFSHLGGSHWECSVPPDLTDGQYIVEIYAIDVNNRFAYWTGILYMLQGKTWLQLRESKYQLQLLPVKLTLYLI